MIILRQKEFTRAEKEAMFQLMRLTKGFKSLPKELNSVENAKRFKKFSNRLVKFANDPEAHKFTAEELKEMKGFLSDIGATKFADNFEPIINKYYGNNVEAWQRLALKESGIPRNELVRRHNRLIRRYRDTLNAHAEVDSFINNTIKSTKGKSNKEIFSSPEGKLMKNIIKGETGGVGQPSIHFDSVKGREKLSDILTKDAGKELKKEVRENLRRRKSSGLCRVVGDNDYGHIFLNSADLSSLSHELGHSKSLANSIAAGTPYKEKIGYPEKLTTSLYIPTKQRARAMYNRLDNLAIISEENMGNVYGRDIIRKYGGKNVNKYLANYDKMVNKENMKSYLSEARKMDVETNLEMTDRIIKILDGKY